MLEDSNKGYYYGTADVAAPISALEVEHTQHLIMLQRALYQQMYASNPADTVLRIAAIELRFMELRFNCLRAALRSAPKSATRDQLAIYIKTLRKLYTDAYCLLDTRENLAVVWRAKDSWEIVIDLFTGDTDGSITPWVRATEMGL